jgi:hypothetical protein
MKKLITNINGGFPFVLDDLRWTQEGIEDALCAIARSMLKDGANAVIITGCAFELVTPSEIEVTEGYMYQQDADGGNPRLCYIPAQSLEHQDMNLDISGFTLRWKYQTETDPAGNKVFNTGLSHETYQITRAYLDMDDDDFTAPTFLESVINTPWVRPTLLSGFNHVSGNDLHYRLHNGIVHIRGAVTGSAGSMFTLPVWCRPVSAVRVELSTTILQDDGLVIKTLYINESGQVEIEVQQSGAGITPSTTVPIHTAFIST